MIRMATMTNTKSNSTQGANKTVKKTDPFAGLKSSIMIVSIAGTMAGWLVLLNQETDSQPVNTAMLSTAIFENNEMAAKPIPIVDISQLRQINEVAPALSIHMVTPCK